MKPIQIFSLFLAIFSMFGCNADNKPAANKILVPNSSKLNAQEEILNTKIVALRQKLDLEFEQKKYSFFNHTFEKNRKLIDTTKLYKVIQSMPKGALLHSHSLGLTNMNWVIDSLKSFKNCNVYTLPDNDKFKFGTLMFYDVNTAPKGFQILSKALKTSGFKDKLLEAQCFKRYSLDADIQFWPEFEKRFLRVGNIANYKGFFKAYHQKAINDLIADNVDHLEIRYIFNPIFDFKTQEYPVDTTISMFKEIIAETKKTNPNFSLKLIYTSLKFLDIATVQAEYAKAYALRKKYPDLIVGFDLVAEEDAGHPVSYFNKVWASSDSLRKIYGVDMPIYMHAGESNYLSNQNIFDVTNIFNKRIGHGLNLIYFPDLIEKIKAKNMLVELNPLSNQILGYVGDLRNHPGRELLKRDVKCAISSDDPGVFGYEGLSYDFFNAIFAWQLDLIEIKKLVYNSIDYSAMTDAEKKSAIKNLDNKWNQFVTKANAML